MISEKALMRKQLRLAIDLLESVAEILEHEVPHDFIRQPQPQVRIEGDTTAKRLANLKRGVDVSNNPVAFTKWTVEEDRILLNNHRKGLPLATGLPGRSQGAFKQRLARCEELYPEGKVP